MSSDMTDLSKNTLLALIVLTIVISIVGTWTVISSANQAAKMKIYQPSQAEGQVKLRILNPNEHITPQKTGVTGKVTFNVISQEEKKQNQ